MAKEVETKEKTVEEEIVYYVCDKCHGHNHEKTQFEEDLNKVVFGAEYHNTYSMPANTMDAHTTTSLFSNDSPIIVGEHEYLLCDECMERAHDYLSDFF